MGMMHACVCVCGRRCLWVCFVSVSGPVCMFGFVIRVTTRKLSLPLRKRNKVLKS